MDPAVIGLVGVLIGAVCTGLVNVALEARKDKREHAKWLREKRWDAYTDVANAVYMVDPARDKQLASESMFQVIQAVERAHLATPPDDQALLVQKAAAVVKSLGSDAQQSERVSALDSLRTFLAERVQKP